MPIDGTAAVRWLRFAVANGPPDASWAAKALYNTGRVLMHGIGGARIDLDEAVHCFRAAADMGDGECALILAMLFLTGGPDRSGRIDRAAGLKWAKRAKELGKITAEVDELVSASRSARAFF